MKILIAIEELRFGGAQTFAMRFAKAWQRRGHKVYLYSIYWQYIERGLVELLAPDVEVLTYKPAIKIIDFILLRLDLILKKLKIDFSLREKVIIRHIRKVIKLKEIEAVNSHTFKCDYLIAKALKSFPHIPVVITMHGDYEHFLFNYQNKCDQIILNYPKKLRISLSRINAIAFLNSNNLNVLNSEIVPANATKHVIIEKIYNGFEVDCDLKNNTKISRAKLGIGEEDLVFGLVGRGEPKKGWESALKAFDKIIISSNVKAHLIFVGDSDYLKQLKSKYSVNCVYYVGYADNPIDYIKIFDVGLMPSSFNESLPNTITEYLYCGKPVIATNVGEIANMIDFNGEKAGFLIDFPNEDLVEPEAIERAMKQYINSVEILSNHKIIAQKAFLKFEMGKCIERYELLLKLKE